MTWLAEKIENAKAEVERLERLAGSATCREMGRHYWQSIGGTNASCGLDCGCSVPVLECTRCGACDYGDNAEAEETRRKCAELQP